MGFRFRKRISIFPGVKINLSKSGISTSLGEPGATINIGKRGVRGTVGLPGSGLSYSDILLKPGEVSSISSQTSSQAHLDLGKAALIALSIAAICIVMLLLGAGLMSARQTAPVFTASPIMEAPAQPRPVDATASSIVTANAVNCRSHPNKRAKVIATLTAGQEVTAIDEEAGWKRITSGDTDCWVSSSLLD